MTTKKAAPIIKIHGQHLVAGLYWQNLVDTTHAKREIVRVGKEANADLVCVPKVKNPSQAGYITKAEVSGLKGIRSLAGGLVESHTGSWLGLFKLPDSDQYYFIAIQNDHILAYTDIVGDLEKIQTTFEQILSCGGWHYVVVPEGMNIPGSSVRHLSLEEMLVKRRAPKLNRLELKVEDIPFRKIFFITSFITSLIIGACSYSSWQEEQKRAEEARLRLEQERAKKAKEQVVNPPWNTAIPVDQFLAACASEWQTVQFSISGWILKEWACEGRQTIISYAKAPMASSLQFMAVAPFASLSKDGQQASIIAPMMPGKSTGSLPAVRGNTAKAAIMDYAERHVMKIAFQPVPPPQAMPGETPAPPPPWTLEKINLDSSYPAFKLELEQIPGLIIKRLSVNKENADWKWHIEGEMYAAK